ncbi:uncharacterized protein [Embiotoca jacksoni]|uniref:uncharacterized protein n=1 Tax=Embiotoca jacksoni TaxID=100190 RepID=UPI00370387DB
MAPSPPAEGTAGATADNSCVTLWYGAGDATEAEANPSLEWHQSEKQLMGTQNEVDEEIVSKGQPSKESMNNISLSNDKDSIPPTYQDQTSMDSNGCVLEACHDVAGRHYQDNATTNEESNEEPEEIVILNEGQENSREKQIPSNLDENSENETRLDKEGDKSFGLDKKDSKLLGQNLDSESVETVAPRPSGLSVDDFESVEPVELCKYDRNKMQAATSQPQVADFPADVTNDNEEYVDSRSLDFNLTKYDWVRRESGTMEMKVSKLPISEASEETVTRTDQDDEGRRISTDIQQGEQLLQRLQLVQQKHDVDVSEIPHTPQQVVKEMKGVKAEVEMGDSKVGGRNLEEEEVREKSRLNTVKKEEAKTNQMEEKNENSEGEEDQTKASMSLSTMPGEAVHQWVAKTEADDSDDNQGDSSVPTDVIPINAHENIEIPFLSTGHRFSAAGTSMEREIEEVAQGKQNLQRAGGVFNLADDPDVLEIPFKTHISLDSLLTMDGAYQHSDWQFSEQKMQKEINQEIQRERVLVNQGKIPGGYSKGEARPLKETKLLFEAFQQDNTEGPTRPRKPPPSVMKGRVYPSVLERTHSLEMFSLKACSISRAHSLRLCKSATSERARSPENLRSMSPTGGSRDKTRLFPYPTQDKHLRLHRSLDSLGSDVSTLEKRGRTRDTKASQESLIQNPFFKLRPALALQPEVQKDIQEAKEREDELRRQRCTLYGDNRQHSEDDDKSRGKPTLIPDARQQTRGKLERVWPPPSKKDQLKSEQTQQDPKVQRAGSQRAPLWQRWESGLINGQPSQENK